MKKRKNIIISAITCLFSICLMMFGVYAATNPSVSINGQVSYTARDASILVQGKMYGADGYETGEYRTVADPTSPTSADVYASVSQYVDYTSADQNKSTMATWELGDGLHFYEDSNGVRDVTLSFKFTNLSKYPVVAKVKSVNVTENNNITLVPPEKTEIYLQQNTSANNIGEMTFAVKVADDSKDAKITFSLVLEFTKLEMTTQGWSVDWYDENQDALRIVGFEGTDAQAVNIPATLSKDGKSYPVKAIGLGIDSVDSVTGTEKCVFAPNAFTNEELNTNLRTAFVSEGIQEIDALSFIACSSLTDVTMPDSVTKIGLGAFANCPLLAYIQIPSSCTKIGQVAFSSAGLKEITLPSTLQSIGTEAFDGCTNLKKVIIEQEDCTKLPCEASIFGTLSNDSTLQIFVKSKDYKTATNWSAYKDYMIVGAFSLDDWTVQIDKPTKTLKIIKYNGDSSVSRLVIPASFQIDGVTYKTVAIGGTSPVNNPQDLNDLQEQLGDDSPVFVKSAEDSNGFNTSIKNIVIEDGIQIIGNYAFSGLRGLESISIPESVTKIGAVSFFFCDNLTKFDFPQNLTEIGYCAFAFSGNVENIEIPAKVTKVDFGLSGFKNITFARGSQLTTIPNKCFAEAQVQTIELPESLTSIGDMAFAQTSVKKIVINSENVTLGNDVFKDYIGDAGIGNDLSNLKIYVPNEFYKTATNWSNYVDNIIVGTLIGDWLVKLDRTNSTCEIVKYYGDMTQETLTIPAKFEYRGVTYNVKSIGDSNDIMVSNLNVNDLKLVFNPGDAFDDGSFISYSTWGWGIDPNMLSLMLESIEGTDIVGIPRFKKVIIENGIEKIGFGAFMHCSMLEEVVMPSTIKSIGSYSFLGCSEIRTLSLPQNLTNISNAAFQFCLNLNVVNLPANVTNIGEWSFSYCLNLKSINLNNKISTIADNAFGRCYKLTSIIIPKSVTSINSSAFYDCHHLSEVINMSNVSLDNSSIVRTATSGESQITTENGFKFVQGDDGSEYLIGYFGEKTTNLVLPTRANEYKIKDYAFSDDNYFVSVTIPQCVTKIGSGAFKQCYHLAEVINLSNASLSNSWAKEYAVRIATSETSQIQTQNDFKFVLGDDGNNYLLGYFGNKNFYKDGKISLPQTSSNYRIKSYAFYGVNMPSTLEIPNCVDYIGEYAFGMGYTNYSVVVSDSVTYIGDMAFSVCDGFDPCGIGGDITIGSGVTHIGYIGTNGTFTINATTPPDFVNFISLDGDPSAIYVPAESVEKYQTAEGWSSYADKIQAKA